MYATIYTLGSLSADPIDEMRVDVRVAETLLHGAAMVAKANGSCLDSERIDDDPATRNIVSVLFRMLGKRNMVITIGSHAYSVPLQDFNPYLYERD